MARPVPCFHHFVGQKKKVDRLRRQLEGAKARGEPFPHLLIYEPSGVGKTELANSLATEYGTCLIRVHGSESVDGLFDKFRNARFGDMVFIDEAHQLAGPAQEWLYPVIDEHRLERERKGVSSAADDNSSVEIPPVTIMLATNQPGRLQDALRKRMQLDIQLDYYAPREMRQIVDRIAADLSILLSPHAANLIAGISSGLPRDAKHHLEKLRRHINARENHQFTIDEVRSFMRDFEIDSKGLERVHRRYLQFLSEEGQASLSSIAHHLGTDANEVKHRIEPPLRRLRFFTIDGGRRLKDTGREWITKHTNNR